MIFEFKYNIGDILVDDKPESVLYRRDCLVVFTDPTFVGIITIGIPRIQFIDADEQGVRCVTSGTGKLTEAQHEHIRSIVADWPDADFLRKLPHDMNAKIQSGGYDPSLKMPLTITGYVAKPLALQWRRYLALAFIAKEHGVDIPDDIESRIFEWMLISTIPNIPSIQILKKFMEGLESNS